MYYDAMIDYRTKVCYGVTSSETVSDDEYYIPIDSLDESYVIRKKYVNGTWVDTTVDEAMQYNGLHVGIFGKWLDQVLGNPESLSTTDKTSLVAAVNECFQSASDGKTAIANAITGVDESITIPDNPTFAQLAALIRAIYEY